MAIVVSILLVLLFLALSLGESGLFKLHPSLMSVAVSISIDHGEMQTITFVFPVCWLYVSSDSRVFIG